MSGVDPKALLDQQVKRKLEDSFGAAMALMIIASAHRSTDVPLSVPSMDDFLKLVDAICVDDRVVGMWGRAGADQALRQWQALV